MGHVGLKTRLLDQIIEKPCVHNRGFIFSRMFTKVCQNVFFFCQCLGQVQIWATSGKKLGQ